MGLAILVAIIAVPVLFLGGTFGERWRLIFRGALRPAVIVGGIAFLLGFVGPMVVTPESNQGPMLGIFITGPLGFLVGLIWGMVAGWLRSRTD
jgi:hypothetical protein